MADKLKFGSVVRPISGGPKMTVQDFKPGGFVICVWYKRSPDGKWTSERIEERIHARGLKLVSPINPEGPNENT